MTPLRVVRSIAVVSLFTACAGDAAETDDSSTASARPVSTASPAPAGAPPHACELITMEEIKALAPAVVLRNRMVSEPTYTEC
ncbi:MAG TPA: hypothetical protein VJ812_03935, partial [Gemmatimonadaceae bacterium]|nr:hypothetical protein [Gemmatimonadaceae bacterium]